MDPVIAFSGLLFLAIGIGELWLAVSLPRAWSALRARLEATRSTAKGGGSGSELSSALDQLEADPRALLVLRVALAAFALSTIAFAWGFVTVG